MRKFFFLFTFALVVFSPSAFSQDLLSNAFFLEVGGISPQFSINYEKIFAQNRSLALASRLGFSINRTNVAAPFGISIITVPGSHHLQLTVGATPLVQDYNSFSIQGSDTFLYLDSGVGYRFQQRNFPFFGFVTVNPLLKLDPTVDSFFGNDDQEFIFQIGVAAGYKW